MRAAGAADIVMVKVQPLGGVRAALRVAEACGLPVVVSSAVDTSVGLAAGVALAAALPDAALRLRPGHDVAAERRRDRRAAGRGGRVLPVRRPPVDQAALARWETDPGHGGSARWRREVPAPGPPERGSPVNPSTAFAAVLADELARCGLREVVVAPGSRSAPLAMAFDELDRAGRIRLHVRIDERSASFTALGLAKASGRPVAVVCTSGTAAANFHPAVIEADESAIPLLLLTADRPPELRGTGASQTVDQVKLYGSAVRWYAESGVPERLPGMAGYWRSLACRAWAHAAGDLGTLPGPVHLNIPLRDPLVPDARPSASAAGQADGLAGLAGRAGGRRAVDADRRRPPSRSRWSCRGPSAAWWCAATATTTRPPSSSWPSRRAGRCSPSLRPAPGAGRTPSSATSTCSRRRSSWRRTGRR